jgi:hypothetical protein
MDLIATNGPALPDPAASRRIVAEGFGHLLRLIGPAGRFTYAHPCLRHRRDAQPLRHRPPRAAARRLTSARGCR